MSKQNALGSRVGVLAALIAVPIAVLAATSVAAADWVVRGATIKKVMVDGRAAETNSGGCAASLTLPVTRPPFVWPPDCQSGSTPPEYWVTFSCTGQLATTTLQAYRLLDQAQLAFATGKKVDVYFTDDVPDGYCFAYRIDLVK